jgi:hypothetical protein
MAKTGKLKDMLEQARRAQEEIARLEQKLRDAGWVNTIHDCWEKPRKPKPASKKRGKR